MNDKENNAYEFRCKVALFIELEPIIDRNKDFNISSIDKRIVLKFMVNNSLPNVKVSETLSKSNGEVTVSLANDEGQVKAVVRLLSSGWVYSIDKGPDLDEKDNLELEEDANLVSEAIKAATLSMPDFVCESVNAQTMSKLIFMHCIDSIAVGVPESEDPQDVTMTLMSLDEEIIVLTFKDGGRSEMLVNLLYNSIEESQKTIDSKAPPSDEQIEIATKAFLESMLKDEEGFKSLIQDAVKSKVKPKVASAPRAQEVVKEITDKVDKVDSEILNDLAKVKAKVYTPSATQTVLGVAITGLAVYGAYTLFKNCFSDD